MHPPTPNQHPPPQNNLRPSSKMVGGGGGGGGVDLHMTWTSSSLDSNPGPLRLWHALEPFDYQRGPHPLSVVTLKAVMQRVTGEEGSGEARSIVDGSTVGWFKDIFSLYLLGIC